MFNSAWCATKRLSLRAYKIQMIHAPKPSDQVARTNFTLDKLQRIYVSPEFLLQVCFLHKAMFHVNGVVNRYNCSIWSSQNPHFTCELERGSPKVNVWAGLMHKLIQWFFFSEKTVTRCLYLDMPELYALPQWPPQTILQQDGVPSHFCHHVRNHLDREMAGR
jgi:hypothetical protein